MLRALDGMSSSRYNHAFFVGSEESELERVPDAAWAVDGGDICHGLSLRH